MLYGSGMLSASTWQGKPGECLDVFKVYIVGRQVMEEDRTVFLTFANVWNLLNIFGAVGSGYAVQLHGDVTFKASQAALNKLGFGVNMFGSHFAPVSYTLIPAECESSHCEAYKQAWSATKAVARRIMSLRLYDSEVCKTCTYIRDLKEIDTVAACLAGRQYRWSTVYD